MLLVTGALPFIAKTALQCCDYRKIDATECWKRSGEAIREMQFSWQKCASKGSSNFDASHKPSFSISPVIPAQFLKS
jgi:hypothetical protein